MLLNLLFASLAAGQLVVNYDQSVEGKIDEFTLEEMVVGNIGEQAKAGTTKNPLEQRDASENLLGRAVLSADGVMDVLRKRQMTCNAGWGYCSNFGRCCPSGTKCCQYGYCLPSDSRCCPSGPCKINEQCCDDRCIPAGTECCKGGRYCEAGNHCYIKSGSGLPVCCTDSKCTARVTNGHTTYASTSTTTRTYSTTRTQYYYWTVTWSYYYYYWTYSAVIEASVVTSQRRSTSSVLSVQTTAADAASSYFSSVSQTLVLPTPAFATSLASMTGSTIKGGASAPGPTAPPNGDDNGDDSQSTTPAAASGTNRPGSKGGAGTLWSRMDVFMTLFLALGTSTGVLAIIL